MIVAIAEERLRNQSIANPLHERAEDVVTWLGAVQAQEYLPAKWALALRMREGATNNAIERALDDAHIIRTHLLRPTWHFVPAADVRWMLQLTAPRVHRVLSRYYPHHGIDAATCRRATRVIERALGSGEQLTRAELGSHLARAGVKANGIKLALLSMHAELEGVICSGKRRGKQLTYALLDERVGKPRRLTRDESLAELTRRYFRSHGPATIRDFVWWSGLTVTDARTGLESIKPELLTETVDGRAFWFGDSRGSRAGAGTAYLLPAWDEFTVAYRDRTDILDHRYARRVNAGGGVLSPVVVIDGIVVGTWRRAFVKSAVVITPTFFRRLGPSERALVTKAAERYRRFIGADSVRVG